MLKINKLKPVTIISALLANKINICFAQKILEKYGANRFRSKFVTLVFRRGHKGPEETRTAAKTTIPEVVKNHSWYFNEYKPVINILPGRKEPVYLKTIKDKPVHHYIYKNEFLYKTINSGGKPELERSLSGKRYQNRIGSELIKTLDQSVKVIAERRKDVSYRTEKMRSGRLTANETAVLNKQLSPDNRILQYSTTSLQNILHHNRQEMYVYDDSKAHYSNPPPVFNSIQTQKTTSLIPGELTLGHIDVNTEIRHFDINKNPVAPIHFEESEELHRNLKSYHHPLNYRSLNNITGLSTVYKLSKNILVQAAEIHRKVNENTFYRLNRTNIRKERVLKELYYMAAPGLVRLSEKHDRAAVDGGTPMPTQKNTPGVLQKSNDSGLILYREKREKPPAAKNQLPEDELSAGKEVYSKTVTSSKPVKVSVADNAEEVNLIAEKVYGIIEKRLEIQKDRRGLR